MKFNPTWQQLVLLAILFAAVIVAHLVAPPAVGIITSMVSTVIGYLCGSPLKPAEPPAPVLSIVRHPENEDGPEGSQ